MLKGWARHPDDKCCHAGPGACPVRMRLYPFGMMRVFSPLLVLLVLWPGFVWAEVRALLIGVGDYAVLDADLQGPPADVALMARVLAGRGVSDIRRLSTAPKEVVPTRAAILAAMADLAGAAQAGDTVLFYFSGHGAQAPDASGDEGGGYDEILLPADAAGWKGSIGSVENALIDDELQLWAQGMLSRGVQVVGLMDACHSATGFRAVGGQGVARGLSAQALGIPAEAPNAPRAEGEGLSGAFVFLYSSQSDQRSFEYPLPDGSAWHGAFTLALAEVLRTAPEASWGQVLRATGAAMQRGAGRQEPAGEGPLLEATLFGTAAPARFAVQDGLVQAGAMQGLAAGAELGLFAVPVGGDLLGATRLTKVTAQTAQLQAPVSAAAWAEVLVPAPLPALALAAPARADAANGFDYAPWLTALPAPGAGADLVPVLVGGGLALAGADGVLDPAGPGSSPRVVVQDGETPADAVARVLEQAAHSLHLRAVITAMAGRSLTGKPVLEAKYERRAGQREGEGCAAGKGPLAAVDPSQGIAPCDQLWLTFTNVSGGDLDVSALYFNADFTVLPVWPASHRYNRLAPGESARAGVLIAPDMPPAQEELLLVAVPVSETGERVDLTRLATPDMGRAYPTLQGAVEGWFEDRVRGDETNRGFSARPAAVMMLRQPVRVRETGP